MSNFRFTVLVIFGMINLGVKFLSTTPYPFPELKYFPKMPVSTDNPVSVEGTELGRYLFYDPILSKNHDMSCASCHKQQFAFADNKPFSIGNNGVLTKRNSMPLFNLAWNSSFFWDGRATSIENQVFHPVRDSNEMNLDWNEAVKRLKKHPYYRNKFKTVFSTKEIDSILVTKAIGQFLRTLISYQSKFDRVLAGKDFLTKDEYTGFVLMNDMTKGDCLHCHTTDSDPLGTTGKFSNNGLDKVYNTEDYIDKGLGNVTGRASDNGKFRIPSLRNIAVTSPYMHDGRFQTLDEVLDFYSEGVKMSANIDSKMGLAHQGGVRLSSEEKRQIKAFLNTLTDSIFLANPNIGNPFK